MQKEGRKMGKKGTEIQTKRRKEKYDM